MSKQYRTVLADPPWPLGMTGLYTRHFQPAKLVYPTMSMDEIKAMRVGELAEPGAHLWLWVVDGFLREGFDVLDAWGFKYLAPIVWVKGSGCGNYFVHQTEFLLFGYKQKCEFNKARYQPNVYYWKRGIHSRKPAGSYELIESISDEPRLELFARPVTPLWPTVPGWDVFGNEVTSDIDLATQGAL